MKIFNLSIGNWIIFMYLFFYIREICFTNALPLPTITPTSKSLCYHLYTPYIPWTLAYEEHFSASWFWQHKDFIHKITYWSTGMPLPTLTYMCFPALLTYLWPFWQPPQWRLHAPEFQWLQLWWLGQMLLVQVPCLVHNNDWQIV